MINYEFMPYAVSAGFLSFMFMGLVAELIIDIDDIYRNKDK